MNCSPLMAPVFLQETHLVRTFRMAEIAPGIQYFCLKRQSVWLLPLFPRSSWMCLIMSWVMWWSFGRITGCLASDGMADLFNLPPTLINWSWRIGASLRRWLLPFTTFPLLKAVISSVKRVCWQNWRIATSASWRFSTERDCVLGLSVLFFYFQAVLFSLRLPFLVLP